MKCHQLLFKVPICSLDMAEECLKRAMDLSGLLLLYSSLGDAEGITQLASLAKDPDYRFELAIQLGRLEVAEPPSSFPFCEAPIHFTELLPHLSVMINASFHPGSAWADILCCK